MRPDARIAGSASQALSSFGTLSATSCLACELLIIDSPGRQEATARYVTLRYVRSGPPKSHKQQQP